MADEKKYSIEKQEPGFWDSLLGDGKGETVVKDEDGNTVAHVKTEEPGLLGSIFGEQSQQVIVDSDGNKLGSFSRDEPGMLGSVFGQEAKDMIVNEQGEKIATFEREEPGLIGSLFGEKAKTVLVDNNNEKIATFGKEEPGLIGSLLGEKSKRVVYVDPKQRLGKQNQETISSGSASYREVSNQSYGSYSSSSSSSPHVSSDSFSSILKIGFFIVVGLIVIGFITSSSKQERPQPIVIPQAPPPAPRESITDWMNRVSQKPINRHMYTKRSGLNLRGHVFFKYIGTTPFRFQSISLNYGDIVHYMEESGIVYDLILETPSWREHVMSYQTFVQAGFMDPNRFVIVNPNNPNETQSPLLGTDLYEASLNGDSATVERLIQTGANVNTSYGMFSNDTALIAAARQGHYEVVRLLIGAGANVNAQNSNQSTALINAVLNRYENVVRALVESGANPNHQNYKGKSALMIAQERQDQEIINILQQQGSNSDNLNTVHQSTRLGGVDLNAFCRSLGFEGSTLTKAQIGPTAAYDNWVCVLRGSALSINLHDACAWQYQIDSALAIPTSPDDAFTWICYSN